MDIKQALVLLAYSSHKSHLLRLIVAVVLVVLTVFWFGFGSPTHKTHLQNILERGTLKVITRESPTTFYNAYQGPDGVEYQLASRFAEGLGVELDMFAVESITEILAALQSGEADMAAAGLSITAEREIDLSFSPPYQQVSQKLVFKQGKRWPRNIEQLNGELRVMADSSHAQKLLELKQQYPALSWTETQTESSEDLLADILNESIDYTISDSNSLALNRRFYPELAIGFSIGEEEQLAWAFHKNQDDSLRAEAISFFGEFRQSGELAHLMERNYGHVEDFDYVGTRQFLQATEEILPKYSEIFLQASEQGIDWRLLAAISYQESHWNPDAISPTGVRGMMMLTLRTAKQLGVKNRLSAEESIKGGAKYFAMVLKSIPDHVTEPDRSWFTLAAYNIGWGHVEDARIITQRQGGDDNRWAYVKEALPLLRQKKYYQKTKYGYARGDEPVQYVDNIRRYYETLQWATDESDIEWLSNRQILAEQSEFISATKKVDQLLEKPAAEQAQTEN